ncbi:unnamed protein product [Cuscuta campestris]|uniref:Uncharacterized protein n=1 Tax=Cuscuta campestris TaxID=132261 RepID=A0A484MX51_9ASTE|nr:unnamed protein product [Cuscuta campestris]
MGPRGRTPECMVRFSMKRTEWESRLEALAYSLLRSSPEGQSCQTKRKKANLHSHVGHERVYVAKEHNLVVVGKVAIGDCDRGGRPSDVDQTVRTTRQGAVVDPDVPRASYGYPVSVRLASVLRACWARAYHSVPRGLAVGDLDVVNNHIGDVRQGQAPVSGDEQVGAAAVDGLVAVEDQLMFQRDRHVAGEHDPQRLRLDHRVPESPRFRVHDVQVRRVVDCVDGPAFAAHRSVTEPDAAVRQVLAVVFPARVAPPAVVDRVSGEAWVVLRWQQSSP